MNLNEFMSGFEPPKNDDYSALPEGVYDAVIDSIKIEQKDCTNKETGKTSNASFAKVCYKIEGPTSAGRLVWDNAWLTHPNPKANMVGKSKLHKLSQVIGIAPASTQDEYIGKRCQITLTVRDGKYNDVKSIQAAEEKVVSESVQPPADETEEEPSEW